MNSLSKNEASLPRLHKLMPCELKNLKGCYKKRFKRAVKGIKTLHASWRLLREAVLEQNRSIPLIKVRRKEASMVKRQGQGELFESSLQRTGIMSK